ncbi:dehydrogenase/reductase SDR family member 7-like [Genypterus blacodes]|uniref:dehydrogenase/reductase SDR family member 7-like n=1 Tax=Genypterus blacodes TaxID=154954 RepID=UPI003F773D5F
MELCLLSALSCLLVLCGLIQLLRFIFADADLTLQWACWLGSRPESKLRGQVVWVTGASSGIGEELAHQLAGCGCRLILSSRRLDELNRVKRQCLERSSLSDEDIFVLPLDLMERNSHEAKTKAAIEHFGNIDILINNGGRSQRSLCLNTSVDVDQAIMELNYLGTVSLTKEVLPHMTQRGTGSVVTVGSLAGLVGVPLASGYSASKHALQGFFNSVRSELHKYPNILISMVCPGPVQSMIIHNAFTEELNKPLGTAVNQDFKMPTSRCVRLMLVGMANGVKEMWIGQQPFLLLFYAWQYAPTLGMFIINTLGKDKGIFRREGLNVDSNIKKKSS